MMATSASKHQIAGLYDLEETLGEGHYAVVKLARHVFTGEKVAVKVGETVVKPNMAWVLSLKSVLDSLIPSGPALIS